MNNINKVNTKRKACADKTVKMRILGRLTNPKKVHKAIQRAYSPDLTHSSPKTKAKSHGPKTMTTPNGTRPISVRANVVYWSSWVRFSPWLAASEIRG